MAVFDKPKKPTSSRRKDIPKGLWVKCPVSGEIVFSSELEANLMVVPKSGYHFPIHAERRLQALLDPDSFEEMFTGLASGDPLEFTASVPYVDKLREARELTGANDPVRCGSGRIFGTALAIAVMDFRFMGASMGSVSGEKLTRTIELAIEKKMPCVIICSSGGARMQEGILSLMQMAKTSAALARLAKARLPYISVLTHPTMAGVMASFASLGDVILAEPGALIGFAGPRVIKETTRQTLPSGFQTAEFLLKHGLIDQIVSRLELRERLHSLLCAFHLRRQTAL